MKKKTLLTAALASIFTLSICTSAGVASAQANETGNKNLKKNCPPDCKCPVQGKTCSQDCKCSERLAPSERMSPEERRAEFEKRMNLTEEQKSKLEAIKAEEHKKLEPVRNKMKKKHDEMRDLIKKEAEIRKASMQKFEAVLTEEQKSELLKMKFEIQQQMRPDFVPGGPEGPKFGPGGQGGPEFGPDR